VGISFIAILANVLVNLMYLLKRILSLIFRDQSFAENIKSTAKSLTDETDLDFDELYDLEDDAAGYSDDVNPSTDWNCVELNASLQRKYKLNKDQRRGLMNLNSMRNIRLPDSLKKLEKNKSSLLPKIQIIGENPGLESGTCGEIGDLAEESKHSTSEYEEESSVYETFKPTCHIGSKKITNPFTSETKTEDSESEVEQPYKIKIRNFDIKRNLMKNKQEFNKGMIFRINEESGQEESEFKQLSVSKLNISQPFTDLEIQNTSQNNV
jgi:hypothetical protein